MRTNKMLSCKGNLTLMSSTKVWMIILSITLLYPAFYCIHGVLVTLDTINPRSHEGNLIIGIMWMYSSIVWIPYFLILGFNWKKLSNAFKLFCSFSSIVIFGCVIYSLTTS